MATARTTWIGMALVGLLTVATGCSGADSDENVEAGEEQALTTAKTLAKGVGYPSGITATSSHVYYGSNHFVASGDPDLDQQFAYWEGKYSRVAVAGGRSEVVAEIGPVNTVRAYGDSLFYTAAQACWISAIKTSGSPAASRTVYRDDNCDPEGGSSVVGFDIVGDKLVVVNSDGLVRTGPANSATELTNAQLTKVGEVRIGDWGDIVSSFVVADGNVFIVTQPGLSVGNAPTNAPQSLYKVSLGSRQVSKVLDFTGRPNNVVTDGKNVFFGDNTNPSSVYAVLAGSNTVKEVASGLGSIIDLAADGTNLYIADSKRGAIYVVGDVATTPKKQKKLASAKGIQSLGLAPGALYFGTHVIENRKYAGIIGKIDR